MDKKLYRLKDDRKISGVCSGIAEYINADPTVVRLLYALLTMITGFWIGIVLYIVCVVIIPDEPEYIDGQYKEK